MTTHDLRRMHYRLGGRGTDGTIDCMGVVLRKAAELGFHLPDPWDTIREQWAHGGLDMISGFPAGWSRLDGDDLVSAMVRPRNGDVWILRETKHVGAGIAEAGRIWTAKPSTGTVHLEPRQIRGPAEVWRRC